MSLCLELLAFHLLGLVEADDSLQQLNMQELPLLGHSKNLKESFSTTNQHALCWLHCGQVRRHFQDAVGEGGGGGGG